VKLHAQPFQLLLLLLEHPGEILTREDICRELWPGDTFVDYEHGLNSAINRLREALGDRAGNPRFVETLSRRGYRFVAPVERIQVSVNSVKSDVFEEAEAAKVDTAMRQLVSSSGILERVLATPQDLPTSSHAVVRALFLLLQWMYLAFYVGALANLAEIGELLSALPSSTHIFLLLVITAAVLIPVRAFLLCGVLFQAPDMRGKILKIWPCLLLVDILWSLSPFLLLHHIDDGLALACTTLLVYAPFAQRSLVLMGAASHEKGA
jgi:DNA-binding winged helix-turn-helix (wHTH) protein